MHELARLYMDSRLPELCLHHDIGPDALRFEICADLARWLHGQPPCNSPVIIADVLRHLHLMSEEAYVKLKILDKQEELCAIEEQLGEIESQYHAECAHYGDAWPGSAIQIADLREHHARVQAELAALNPKPVVEDIIDEDIPF